VDQKINRDILAWLRQWDSVVFKRQSNAASVTSSIPTGKAAVHDGPAQKVILLVGSPGVGKTTLAHVLGKMAGYSTIEINARYNHDAHSLWCKQCCPLIVGHWC
jgi:chromosome transmission fidelity protein 18